MVSEKYILVLQILASVFMGLDYFLTEEQRGIFNKFLKRHLHPLQQSEEEFLSSMYLKAKNNWLVITRELAIFSISLIVVLYIVPATAAWINIWVSLVLIVVSMLGLLLSANKLFDSTCEDGVPVVFSLLKISLARFLIRCPKGTGFGVGFLFLAASFVCRSINIDW